MSYRFFSKSALCAGAVLAALISVTSPARAQVHGTVIIQSGPQLAYRDLPPPPPPRVIARPSQRNGKVWVEGHWEWRGSRYVWNNGYWVKARRGYAYAQPRWYQEGGQWRYTRGEWRAAKHGRGHGSDRHDKDRHHSDRKDRDHDGWRTNRDRDRDGDGVRNNRDRKPDNPNRY